MKAVNVMSEFPSNEIKIDILFSVLFLEVFILTPNDKNDYKSEKRVISSTSGRMIKTPS
jgi:hypothetical protein